MANFYDKLVRKTSMKLKIDEDIVDKVVHFKWKSLHEALYIHQTIEDSGLAKFKLRQLTLRKQIKLSESKIAKWQQKLAKETREKEANTLKVKIENEQEILDYLNSRLTDEIPKRTR